MSGGNCRLILLKAVSVSIPRCPYKKGPLSRARDDRWHNPAGVGKETRSPEEWQGQAAQQPGALHIPGCTETSEVRFPSPLWSAFLLAASSGAELDTSQTGLQGMGPDLKEGTEPVLGSGWVEVCERQ